MPRMNVASSDIPQRQQAGVRGEGRPSLRERSLAAPEPETRASDGRPGERMTFKRQGQEVGEGLAMSMFEVAREQRDLECSVVLEKAAQEIRLVPRPLSRRPDERVLEWPEDVVEVHVHARLQRRKDLEEKQVHFASPLRDVRGVDEENLVSFER